MKHSYYQKEHSYQKGTKRNTHHGTNGNTHNKQMEHSSSNRTAQLTPPPPLTELVCSFS